MHLKTLTIKGFKSFASSTTLRLEPGITAVVGPNGSGKSNVVDALTWVMGEQGAKNLRGGTMADVIFAGAGSRPALGRAEVSLTIDNADGALPIDYSEVTITRTLFRGGGSEYQINGAQCRLLDVQELLSDTGLGRQMHVIVGQGQLDAVLSATPEDRRGFIEEAAGVLKHRRRKERALRKLDSMAADLARVADLANELHRQLGPLAKQAAVARRARTIQIEVRDATARLLADDVVAAQQLLEAGQEDTAAVTARRAAAEEAEKAARDRLAGLAEVEAGAGRRLAAATEVWESLTDAAQRLSSLADVAVERVRGLANAPKPSFGTDPEELDRRAEAAAAEEAELAERIESTRSALAAATQERAEAEAAQSTAESALAALQRSQAEHRERVARAGGRLASARSRHEAATAAREQARIALAAAEERRAAAQAAVEEAAPGTGDGPAPYEDAPGSASAEQVEAAARHEAATAALASARDALAAATEARSQAASEQATWAARRDALALSLRAEDSTAELAEAGLEGLLGPLPEHVSIEKGWENAIAALLGDLAAAALAADEAAAIGALERARRAEAGAIRLIIAQEGAGDDGAAGALEPPVEGGGTGLDRDIDRSRPVPPVEGAVPARGLVTIQAGTAQRSGLQAALDRLLAGAWAVPDLATGAAARATDPRARVVTRDGDILAPGWAAGGGRGSASVLELAAAHDEAASRAEAAREAQEAAETALAEARQAEEARRHGLTAALERLRRADAEAAREAEVLARLVSAAHAATEEAGRAGRVLERAEEETAQRAAELAAASTALAEIEQDRGSGAPDGGEGAGGGAPVDAEVAIEEARARRDEAAEAATAARAAETDARLALRTAEERERSGRGRSDSLRLAARRERESRAAAERAQERRARQLLVAKRVRDEARRAAEAGREWATEAADRRAAVEAERAESLEATRGVRDEIDRLTKEIAALTDAAYREEIARAEHRTRLEALAERALTELGLELDPLVEEFGPHMPVPEIEEGDAELAPGPPERPGAPEPEAAAREGTDAQRAPRAPTARPGRPYARAEQEKRLARAKRDLARLGKVNPLAFEEHAALQQRHRFLAEQLADLKRSRADLLGIVEEIDARVQEVFTSAYQDTAREFTSVFDRLFPGGEGRLVLTDPGDMLTTGIEIEARPAGKKVKRLSLLSGGERSLAAVALLIAIFKARPSPFYVMDEVEAALDDTNLGRLLEIFTELRESSQLIIITHQKRTMEVADALYGITMRDGVTQAVSQRLARE
ncbi:AAA family ATPase [Actinomyces timonensis]|uniref:Chromosome partition protein Smc n=1 Tax=Actinomyces timonensis TaxID=1288391 RepID=A0AAU8N608_9ACTO